MQNILCYIAMLYGILWDDFTYMYESAQAQAQHTHLHDVTGLDRLNTMTLFVRHLGFDHVVFMPSWVWSGGYKFFQLFLDFILAPSIELKLNFQKYWDRDSNPGAYEWKSMTLSNEPNWLINQKTKFDPFTRKFFTFFASFSFMSWNNLLLCRI